MSATKTSAAKRNKPQTFRFTDDGIIPNNPDIQLLVYRGAIDLVGTVYPEIAVGRRFGRSGWGEMWCNGIYPCVHYRSTIHEALSIARGRARSRFGGEQGLVVDVTPGDVAVLPACTGHQCLWAVPDLSVIGAYPKTGRHYLCRGRKAERSKWLETIPHVPRPDSDPVYGKNGPLVGIWCG